MLLSLIGAGISAATSIAGGISAAKKKKESERMLEAKKNSLEYWYNKEKNEDFLDSAIAKSTLSILENENHDKEVAMNSEIVRDGATAEEKIAMASALNKNYANAVGDLVTVASERDGKIDNYYRSQLQAIDNEKYNNLNAGSAISATLGSVGGGISTALTSLDSLTPLKASIGVSADSQTTRKNS